MTASQYVHIKVARIAQETDKAFKVLLEDGRIWWIPKSQMADPDDYAVGDEDFELAVTKWLHDQKEEEG